MNNIIEQLFEKWKNKMNEYSAEYEKTKNVEYDIKSSNFGGAAVDLHEFSKEGKTLEDLLNKMKYLDSSIPEKKKMYPEYAEQIEIEHSVYSEIINDIEKALYGVENGEEIPKNLYQFDLVLDDDAFASATVEAWTEELAIDAVYTYIREHVKARLVK